jgi:hypothetical protein
MKVRHKSNSLFVWLPMGYLKCSADLLLPATLSTQPLTEMSTRNLPLGGPTTLPPLCTGCLKVLVSLASWSPEDLSRPVQGLLCLYPLQSINDRRPAVIYITEYCIHVTSASLWVPAELLWIWQLNLWLHKKRGNCLLNTAFPSV